MNQTLTTRDDELGAALRTLDVPEHAPGFHDHLRRRLTRTGRRRRWPMALAAAMLVVAVALGATRLVGDRVEVASAAEVKASVRAGLGAVATMRGRIVSISPNPLTGERETHRWRFVATADGDFRLEELGGPGRIAYDARTGLERQLNTSASIGTGLFAVERSGLAPGEPDAAPADWILQRDLGSVVRALMAASDPRVTEIEYEGREAWRVDVDVPPNAIYADADRLAITVDQATGIPVRVVETLRGSSAGELRVEGLSLLGALPADAFELAFPRGIEVTKSDAGFRRLPMSEVASAAGYAPLVPQWVPTGFLLTEVAFARAAGPTGTEAGNPPSQRVVSLSYRRGFDQFLVTTRLAGAGSWSDPLATGEGIVDDPVSIALHAGALAGSSGKLVVEPRGVPHLWSVTDDLVVTVSGDLGRSELVRVAESLDARQ